MAVLNKKAEETRNAQVSLEDEIYDIAVVCNDGCYNIV